MLKLDKSKPCRLIQSKNIPLIFVTLLVSKDDKSKLIKDSQESNICDISSTLLVLKLLKINEFPPIVL